MKGQRVPTKVTLDAYTASHRAVADLKADGELPERVVVRSSKYLNNLIEQDHRRIKQRLRPMLGLRSFETAAIVIVSFRYVCVALRLGCELRRGPITLSRISQAGNLYRRRPHNRSCG